METRTPSIDARQALQLAQSHRQAGRLDDAERVCRSLLEAEPDNAEVWHLLGVIAHQGGNYDMAVELLEEAARLGPAKPDALHNLGGAYQALGRAAEAEKRFRGALALKPDHLLAQNNLGIALRALGRLEEAEQSFRRAAALRPDYAEAHNNLGNALRELGRLEEAERSFVKARTLKPDYAEAHGNLGITLRALGRLEEAERSFRQALALKPGYAEAHNDLGATLFGLGRLEEAERSYRDALALDPRFVLPQRNLLVMLNYLSGRGPAEIYAEHRSFARRHYPSGDASPHGNVRDPGRKLRLGYVSGDLRQHPVAYFIEPVLAKHDRGGFEIYCYHNAAQSDAVTERLKSAAVHWRDVFAMNDDGLVNLIREDAIDVLVDLSGHTMHNRLHAFARRPAPVQVTWLGYPNTTGLGAMDYRLTDAIADPPGVTDRFHTEKLVRLPQGFLCYLPHPESPAIAQLARAKPGEVRFGCFNNLAKVTPQMIELWAELMRSLPESKLLLKAHGFGAASSRKDVLERFIRLGIAPGRIDIRPSATSHVRHLENYQSVDIALDVYPYNGSTTTCEALWMGVPVVTLAGRTHVSRVGASLLHAVGLPDLVAQTPEQYVKIAAALALDPARLAALRAGMREQMRSSPLMNAERFTRDLEGTYRTMWRSWCHRRAGWNLIRRVAGKLRMMFSPS